MKHAWQTFHGQFSKMDCNEIISHCLETYKADDATVGYGSANRLDPKQRVTKRRWVDPLDKVLFSVREKIKLHAFRANDNAWGMELYPEFHEFQFLEYNDFNQSHFDWHMDLEWFPDRDKEGPSQRKLSCIIQLSDPASYQGGRLEFELPQRHALPEGVFRNPGDMIFFPSFVKHKVSPVTEGTRYCLTAWFHGPSFR